MTTTLTTTIQSHGIIDRDAKEVYGSGPVVLRLGNGGAGGTGFLKAIAEDYLSLYYPAQPASITWVCNHSRNTQLALLNGYIDIALTYELSQAKIAEDEGWSVTAGPAFHDHFVLAGPMSDPAGLRGIDDPGKAFDRIASRGALFLSRSDNSATMWKERHFWESIGKSPWKQRPDWYIMTEYNPTEAVIAADEKGAYILIDRSTLLRQVGKGMVKQMTVFSEPNQAEDVLMNTCYTLHKNNPSDEVQRFVAYMDSSRAQELVDHFGANEAGMPLFSNVKDQYSRQKLTGGHPENRKWVSAELNH